MCLLFPHRLKLPVLIAASRSCLQCIWRRLSSRRQQIPTIAMKAPPSSNPGEQKPQQKKAIPRPPTLNIKTPPPKQQSPAAIAKDDAQQPLSETQGTGDGIRKRARGSSLTSDRMHLNSDGSGNIRRGSLQPEYVRGVSVGGNQGGQTTYTPKNFKSTLEYNRFVMKKPSSLSTPTPTGQGPTSFKQLGSEDSYLPKIAAHTRNWPSFLARNFFHLMNIRLALTLLINLILLTYQVTSC